MSLATRERSALVAALAEIGPDAPTLCGEWTTRDLAAHLVTRERRPDSAPGIMIGALAGYTDKVRRAAAEAPWEHLLEQVRTGPPWWSPLRPLDSVVNSVEMFVHHEDIRRGSPGWEPRTLDDADEALLWKNVKRMGRVSYKSSPVTVVLETLTGSRVTVKSVGSEQVVLTGTPSELLLHAFGRDEVRLETTGSPDNVEKVLNVKRGV
ncbi:TIGR03085 family metal-binding protein [Antrihabitans cavernicola]|uniref:TIGR03085 family protein n=1 Tax=Antrihabitans cavernicola TaxID=2495913 RepID=A0A5A7SGD5_9NOCA|nr:TIGR03085 family metal-binding protein [Spelaeibacter cavernicola]KAA0023321.1 TIGR03085 family protein [Spelaeibacter cavernicola]